LGEGYGISFNKEKRSVERWYRAARKKNVASETRAEAKRGAPDQYYTIQNKGTVGGGVEPKEDPSSKADNLHFNEGGSTGCGESLPHAEEENLTRDSDGT